MKKYLDYTGLQAFLAKLRLEFSTIVTTNGLNTRLQSLENLVGSAADADTVINKFNEIVDFLAGIDEPTAQGGKTLAQLLQEIATAMASYLPLSGGTVTGNLTVNGNVTTGAESVLSFGSGGSQTGEIGYHDAQPSGYFEIFTQADLALESSGDISFSSNSGDMEMVLTDSGLLVDGKAVAFDDDIPYDSIVDIERSGTTFTATKADGTTFTFTQQDNDTWKAATTSQEGYAPQLAIAPASGGANKQTIDTQASDLVLTYASGTETAPVWRKLPANAYKNTTYSAATATKLGLLIVSNKLSTAQTLTSGNGATADRFYGVQMDKDGKAFVNIPWTDTTYGAVTQSTAGLMSASDKEKLDGIAAGANDYSLPLAANGTRGGVQIGFSESNSGNDSSRNYAVQLSSEKAYVNVPWENGMLGLDTSGSGNTVTNVTYNTSTKKVVVTKGSMLQYQSPLYIHVGNTEITDSNFVSAATDVYTPASNVLGVAPHVLQFSSDASVGISAEEIDLDDGVGGHTISLSIPLVSATATANTAGTGKVYAVEIDSAGHLAVAVPWTDNNTTYSAMTSAEAESGTSTSARLITPKLLVDTIAANIEATMVAITTSEINALFTSSSE